MEYRDLREWIERVRPLGELREVRGASWQEDIGTSGPAPERPPRIAIPAD